MDIDYADVARGLANKLSAAVFEGEQWRVVAETFQRKNEELTIQLQQAQAKAPSETEDSTEGTD